jgi:dissimilatory sulfite reductase related protein
MVPQINISGRQHVNVSPTWFDEDGFLSESERWTASLAEDLARQAGIVELTAKHWEVIHFVRERYFSIGALPVMRLVCRAAGLDPSKAHKLFSSCRTLWSIAGLPNPGEEAKSYMN